MSKALIRSCQDRRPAEKMLQLQRVETQTWERKLTHLYLSYTQELSACECRISVVAKRAEAAVADFIKRSRVQDAA